MIHTESFTFADFLETATRAHYDASNCNSLRNAESFAGPNIDAARNLAVLGWPEGFAKMQQILSKLESEIRFPSTQDLITTQLIGQSPDIGAYLRGEPECMFQIESAPAMDRKFARVHVSAAVSASTSGDQIFWRGAVAIALVHALERAGFGTELTMDFSSRRHDDECKLFIALKSAGQPIDVNRIAFMFAHRSSLRRLGFSLMEHTPARVRNAIGYHASGGYGSAVITPHPDGQDIHLNFQNSLVHDLETAKKEIQRLLKNLPQMIEASAAAKQANW